MTLSGIEEFIIFGFVPLMIGIFAGPRTSASVEKTLSGKLTIPSLRFVPDNAVTTVELVEQRRGETVLPALAREIGRWRGSVSRKIAVRFDPSLIEPMAYYALRARIVADGKVLFETQYPQAVAPLSGDLLTLVLTAATACACPA